MQCESQRLGVVNAGDPGLPEDMVARSDLGAYRGKRDFARTSEPAGTLPAGEEGFRFVVHKHAASADHYDLRLELGGVLKSWAVPKGPSLDPAIKRYAAQTEDHPVDYLDFEGVIPQGEYGGGPMIVWDTGSWTPMGDAEADLRKGDLKFRLWGEKLRGGWMLVRMKPKAGEPDTNWLLFKERDGNADAATDILAERPESVKSGLTIAELAAAARPAPAKTPAKRPVRRSPKSIAGAMKAAMPQKLKPQLATQVDEPPRGDTGWLHEIKFDGYRTIAHVEDGAVRLLTRTGIDWTARYGVLADAFAALPAKQAIIDGEVVVVDAAGVSHFADLQQALSDGASHRLTFFAFDLAYLDGYDLSGARLDARKAALQALLAPLASASSAIQFSDGVAGDGQALYEQVSEMGLEGIVSKRLDARYEQARSKSWVKVKAKQVGDFPIVGFTTSPAAAGIGALALGEWVEGELDYRGKCGTGFSAEELVGIEARLRPLTDAGHMLARMPRDVIPVRPVLTAHVHYANLTADGSVRHAVFKGLREPEITAAAPVARKRLISDADLAGIWLTNPTRRLFGKSGPTKLDVAIYYAAVGDFMLPHIFGRPVSLVRSPSGRLDDIFFQRHPFTGMPSTIGAFETMSSEEGEVKKYISIEEPKGYLALAQFGVIEFHSWGCHWRAALEKPDRIIFDLDPGEGIRFRQTVEAAFVVREVLSGMGLVPYVKTSGGKGLHVVVPLKPRLDWKKTHAATGEIAERIARAAPELFVVNMAKDKRSRRIFIDFHRNYRGATAVAPYSLRARQTLPASTPVNWTDLRSIDAPEDLNYSTLPEILNISGDPWAAMDQDAADLTAALKMPK